MHVTIYDENTPTRSQEKLNRSNRFFRAGNYEEALEGYRALLVGVGGTTMNANIGYCLQSLSQHEEAVQFFETYVEEFPYRHHAWKALAFSYYNLKDYEMMSRCARESIKWDINRSTPDDYSWQQMATAHFLLDDFSTSLKASRKALQINPHNGFAKYYEACVVYAVAQGGELDQPELLSDPASAEQAALILAEAIALHPDLINDVRSEGYVEALLGFEVLKNTDEWCSVASCIVANDVDKLKTFISPHAFREISESNEEITHQDENDRNASLSAPSQETTDHQNLIDLDLTLSGWTFAQVAARCGHKAALNAISEARELRGFDPEDVEIVEDEESNSTSDDA